MNAPLNKSLKEALTTVSLDDKYTLEKGRAYMSGTQALVRLPLLQQARDEQNGLNTAGFISGYRGSPLGALDQALWNAKKHLSDKGIVFQPGLNEDLAATSIWGTQQVNLFPGAKHDGVFGMWYGKGPGVDRTMDVFKHANNAGTSEQGGVLVLAGDDHGAKSSTVAYQSEHNFIAAGIPVLYPADVQEYLDYGLHGWAMSRHTGLWVAMKCVTEVVESSASVELNPNRPQIVIPDNIGLPEGGLNIRWPDTPLDQEERLLQHKLYAALDYVRSNNLNQIIVNPQHPRLGIMAAGKAWLDTRQALLDLGLDDNVCAELGIRLMKIGCVWPLNAQDAREFATGLTEILVVEEKRQILEYALKEELYNWREDVRPKIYGKFNEQDGDGGEWSTPRGDWLLPAKGELSPAIIAQAIASRIKRLGVPEHIQSLIDARIAILKAKHREQQSPSNVDARIPWFCSGCPHNTSTKVPEGSRALAGIGCHYMTIWMDRNTETFSQMGGEGVAWIGQQHFTSENHVFANLGDGTYFHSGLLAIRASIAANANITYKILYNDAVAMTGGQPVDGSLTVPDIIAQVQAEGAKKVVVVTDEPEKYKGVKLAGDPTVYHRKQLEEVQLDLRNTPGTTVLVYDQTCATEKRRRRKRGTYPDPARRVFINDTVCEGCGDCSVKSNCLSVEPLETDRGTKRQINQSSCNKDFSCIEGFCPSFITAEGAQLRKPESKSKENLMPEKLPPEPNIPAIQGRFGILVTGIGGTGVVTIGGLLGMAAHLESKGVNVLDMAGLAQKGGAVLSHIQIAKTPQDIHSTRITTGAAQTIIGCDALVSASSDSLTLALKDKTMAAINSAPTPTAGLIGNPKWEFPINRTEHALKSAIGANCNFVDASALALELLGDHIYANPLLLGYVWQKGGVPLVRESILRAMELNGVMVEHNKAAFEWGRYIAHYGYKRIKPVTEQTSTNTLDELISKNEKWLSKYQNKAYAKKYSDAIDRIRKLESSITSDDKLPLTNAVAFNLARLMAYKDEYEVARLYTEPEFFNKLRKQFDGEPGKDYKINFYLAPPLLARKNSKGELIKRKFGPKTLFVFRILAKMKWLRGTALDIFGKTHERKQERALIDEYMQLLSEFESSLTVSRHQIAVELASLPESIRGYGHVKEKNLKEAISKRKGLINQYHSTDPDSRAAA